MECLSKKLLRNICHTRRHYSEILRLCPDITGTANYLSVGLTFDAKPQPTGAFYCPNVSANGGVAGDTLWRMDSFQFAARWSSSTYGNSSGVSVSACYALIIIKT